MGWADAAGDGTVLATTRLHVTLDPAFAADLPLSIGSVALDAGPVVLAFLGEDLAPGARLALVEADDSAGRSVFRLARP